MKKNKYLISTIILGLLTITLSTYIIYDKVIKKDYEENKEEEINKKENTDNENGTCTFTKTHHIADLLEDYKGEVPESTFILVDQFQTHYPYILHIPSNMKENLEENKYYEFIYTVPKNNNYETENDILNLIVGDYINKENNIGIDHNVNLEIKKSEKVGLEQINEEICK